MPMLDNTLLCFSFALYGVSVVLEHNCFFLFKFKLYEIPGPFEPADLVFCNVNMKVWATLWCDWGISKEAKYAEIGLRNCLGWCKPAKCIYTVAWESRLGRKLTPEMDRGFILGRAGLFTPKESEFKVASSMDEQGSPWQFWTPFMFNVQPSGTSISNVNMEKSKDCWKLLIKQAKTDLEVWQLCGIFYFLCWGKLEMLCY